MLRLARGAAQLHDTGLTTRAPGAGGGGHHRSRIEITRMILDRMRWLPAWGLHTRRVA